jgi:hypothetical protein
MWKSMASGSRPQKCSGVGGRKIRPGPEIRGIAMLPGKLVIAWLPQTVGPRAYYRLADCLLPGAPPSGSHSL